MLNITNGDSTANLMKEAGVIGDILPWRDVLHEGPVPAGLSFAAMSELRCDYIVSQCPAMEERVRKDFRERSHRLAQSKEDQEIILWFEHDLYDQLQLLQLLLIIIVRSH